MLSEKEYLKVVAEIAKKNNTTSEEVIREMQKAIDEAWDNGRGMEWFLEGRPTIREFVSVMADVTKWRMKHEDFK